MLSAAMVMAGLAQLLCVGAAWLRLETRPRRLWLAVSPAVRRFFVQAIPGVFAGGIPQLKLMAGVMVASSSQAAVSWLYYANRLYELPLGVISIAIASVLGPAIAASVRSHDGAHAAHTQSRAEIAPRCRCSRGRIRGVAGGDRGVCFSAASPRDTAMVAAAPVRFRRDCRGIPWRK
jgi:putative peptidoglycan lipid II flippase